MAKYDALEDIFIFGSIVKGKGKPEDVDIALCLRAKAPKDLIYAIKTEIRAAIGKEADINVLDVYSTLWLVLIREGFSVRKNRFLHEIYKIRPVVLYKYSLKKLNPTQKVQFTRGLDAVIKLAEGNKLTRSVVLIPLKNKIKFDEFLNSWNMLYETRDFELMPVLRKEEMQ